MVQYKNQSRKNLARSLRNGGYSYAEIQKFVSAPKATLSYWFRDIKLSQPQLDRLQKKRSEASRLGSQVRSKRIAEDIEKIQKNSAGDIGKISKRELWLMGVMLYWRHRHSQKDPRTGVRFMSANPSFIRLFLKWLKEIGQLTSDEIILDLFIRGKKDKAIGYWSEETGFPKEAFKHIYRYGKKGSLKTSYGLLQIRVSASSMLARQLEGWIRGIKDTLI